MSNSLASNGPKMEENIPLRSLEENSLSNADQNVNNRSPSDQIKNYRRLAITSIICGISCLGIMALINSVKAQERREADLENARKFSRQARKYSLIAILLWLAILVLSPALLALVTYLLRTAE